MMPAIGTPVAANTSLGASLILSPCLRCLPRAAEDRMCTDDVTALRWENKQKKKRAIRLGTIAKLLLRSVAFIATMRISVDSKQVSSFLFLLRGRGGGILNQSTFLKSPLFPRSLNDHSHLMLHKTNSQYEKRCHCSCGCKISQVYLFQFIARN